MAGPFTSGHKVFNTDINPMLLGWVDFIWFGLTLAYVSADAPTFVFSVDADVTDTIEPGMRIKLEQTTDKFFIVTAVGAFAAGVTPITVYGGTDYTLANAAITAGSFSTHKKPFGFNASPAKWTVTMSDSSARVIATPSASVWINPASLQISIPIGVWDVELRTLAQATFTAGGEVDVFVALSTANNNATDSDLLVLGRTNSGVEHVYPAQTRKLLTLAAKTTYFIVAEPTLNITTIALLGSTSPTIISAICAYL